MNGSLLARGFLQGSSSLPDDGCLEAVGSLFVPVWIFCLG
jgi:hypothetical protein